MTRAGQAQQDHGDVAHVSRTLHFCCTAPLGSAPRPAPVAAVTGRLASSSAPGSPWQITTSGRPGIACAAVTSWVRPSRAGSIRTMHAGTVSAATISSAAGSQPSIATRTAPDDRPGPARVAGRTAVGMSLFTAGRFTPIPPRIVWAMDRRDAEPRGETSGIRRLARCCLPFGVRRRMSALCVRCDSVDRL